MLRHSNACYPIHKEITMHSPCVNSFDGQQMHGKYVKMEIEFRDRQRDRQTACNRQTGRRPDRQAGNISMRRKTWQTVDHTLTLQHPH